MEGTGRVTKTGDSERTFWKEEMMESNASSTSIQVRITWEAH